MVERGDFVRRIVRLGLTVDQKRALVEIFEVGARTSCRCLHRCQPRAAAGEPVWRCSHRPRFPRLGTPRARTK